MNIGDTVWTVEDIGVCPWSVVSFDDRKAALFSDHPEASFYRADIVFRSHDEIYDNLDKAKNDAARKKEKAHGTQE